MRHRILSLSLLFVALAFLPALAQTTYMKDTPADTGVEPNPDTGPMWVSQDIWVRNSPDPNYTPYPFAANSPPWTFPAHQNPVYRDPLKSTPNYVYVEVRNASNVASTGTERLRVYWAKASTGLSWPTQWGGNGVDYEPNGPLTPLYASEITKPRINGATATAAQRNAYVQAILHIGTPTYVFPNGTDYWHTQQPVHDIMGSYGNIHGTLAFEPWHREFVNRYEILLQQYDPTVKLLYWDWTTNPATSLSFMGSFTGSSIGAPFEPALLPPPVSRSSSGSYPIESDSVVLARSPYGPWTFDSCGSPATDSFMPVLENCSHNDAHGNVGGEMSNPATSAQDPFFFMLHGNVDRLWAQWQRNSSNLQRLDPAQTYGASLASDQNLQLTMSPWDGSPGTATSASSVVVASGGNPNIQPWQASTDSGDYVVVKTPDDPSVVSPPIYDTAPLTIPVLQPGQAVVIQIPWYPPNPANFTSFGTDAGHFCLLARIETSATAPYGMDSPETTDVYANTRNNNKIVWKNVEVVVAPGPMMKKSFLVRNIFDQPTQMSLHVVEARGAANSLLKQGRVFVDLKPQLFARWRQTAISDRAAIRPAEEAATSRVEILSSDALIRNIRLEPHETFSVDVDFDLSKDYSPQTGAPAQFDVVQLGAPGDPNQIVGGMRYIVDLSALDLIKSGDQWRYLDNGTNPGPAWMSADYDDAGWRQGATPFGSEGHPETRVSAGSGRFTTAYFRHAFDVADPSFYKSALLRVSYADGAVVYLNGKEVYRGNLPAVAIDADTIAARRLAGLERHVFQTVNIDPAQLKPGKNVIAAEVHANSAQSADIGFDLELLANDTGAGFPPDIAFAAPPDAAVFQAGEVVPVQLEAYSEDAKIASVSLYADGKLVGSSEHAPYTFDWPVGSVGAHRLRAVAVDDRKMESESFHTVTVVDHLLPSVALVRAQGMTAAMAGKPLSFSAAASERNGKIVRVEFWVKDMATWVSPAVRVATVTKAPYTAPIKGLKPGHYMFWAIAINDSGGSTQSLPGHIMIDAPSRARR